MEVQEDCYPHYNTVLRKAICSSSLAAGLLQFSACLATALPLSVTAQGHAFYVADHTEVWSSQWLLQLHQQLILQKYSSASWHWEMCTKYQSMFTLKKLKWYHLYCFYSHSFRQIILGMVVCLQGIVGLLTTLSTL